MKLTGLTHDAYSYKAKDGHQVNGVNYTLYFAFHIPAHLGEGVASTPYQVEYKLARAISDGKCALVIGGEYDIIFTDGKISMLIPVERGKEK